MTAIELKRDLHSFIDVINDENLLQAFRILLLPHVTRKTPKEVLIENDWWETIPEYVQNGIDIGLEQANNNDTIPHEEVMSEIRKKFFADESKLDK